MAPGPADNRGAGNTGARGNDQACQGGRPFRAVPGAVGPGGPSCPVFSGPSFLVGSSGWRVVAVALVEVGQMPASGRKVSVVMQHHQLMMGGSRAWGRISRVGTPPVGGAFTREPQPGCDTAGATGQLGV